MDGKPGTSPRFDILMKGTRNRAPRKTSETGAARLSSARVVKCTVKSDNERNPSCQLQVSGDTAVVNTEEGGDDVKSAWPLYLGRHTCYNG